MTQGNAYISINDAIGRQAIEDIPGLSNARPHFATENAHEDSVIPHGTHVAGIVGADGTNGIHGGCPGCSLFLTTTADGYDAIYNAAKSGVQIVNISYGGSNQNAKTRLENGDFKKFTDIAEERDILIVSATGNNEDYQHTPQYPAQFAYEGQNNILPVGGLQPALINENLVNIDSAAALSFYVSLTAGEQWNPLQSHDYAGCQQVLTSQNPGIQGVMAPAAHILSLYPTGGSYGSGASTCIWSDGENDPITPNDGVGLLTGTSMAAPHITALAGLVRSVNPLLTAEEVIEIIQLSSDETSNPTAERGHGMPNASTAIDLTVQSNPDLLTPLFAFQNRRANVSDAPFFYTTVPQMALSALHGELVRAGDSDISTTTDYIPYGAPISGYTSFPGMPNATDSPAPKAAVQVYTVPTLPSGSELVPLYRMSNALGFAYATSELERIVLQSEGFELDGIEGYLHPSDNAPDDNNATLLIQGYNNTTHSYGLYAEGSEQTMRNLGYQPSSVLGYAVINNPSYREPTTPSQLPTGPCSLRTSANDLCVIDAIAQYSDQNSGEFIESVYAYGHLWQFDEYGNQIGETQNLRDIPRYATGPCSRAANDEPCTIRSATTMDYPNEGIGYVESPYAYGYFWNFFASGEQWPKDSTNRPLSSVGRYAEGACEGRRNCSFDTRNLIVWEGWGDGLIESITVGDNYWIYDGTYEILQSGSLRDIDRFAEGPCQYGPSSACRFDSRDLYNDKNGIQWETVTAYGRYFEWKDGAPTVHHGKLLTEIERLR